MAAARLKNPADLLIIVMVLIGLGVGAVWLLLGDGDSAPTDELIAGVETDLDGVVSADAIAPSIIDIETLADKARLAMVAGQYLEPDDGSAVHYFLAILNVDPEHPQARDGLEQILEQLSQEAVAAARDGRMDVISALLARLRANGLDEAQVATVVQPLQAEGFVLEEPAPEEVAQPAGTPPETAGPQQAASRDPAAPPATAEADAGTSRTVPAQPAAPEPTAAALPSAAARSSAPEGQSEKATRTSPVQPAEPSDRAVAERVSEPKETRTSEPDPPATTSEAKQTLTEATAPGQRKATDAGAKATAAAAAKASAPPVEPPDPAAMVGGAAKARPPQRADAQPPAPAPPVSSGEVAKLLEKANASVSGGRLVAPANDNAQHYLMQAREIAPENAALQKALNALVTVLVGRARVDLGKADYSAAESWLQHAEELGARAELVADMRTAVDVALAQNESAQVISAKQLELERYVPPRYPNLALRRDLEGWVDVEFTVTRSGETSDIRVLDTSRKGYFEQSVLDAVSQWRYVPRTVRGRIIDQRVALRVDFRLDD